jgi:predicted ATPase
VLRTDGFLHGIRVVREGVTDWDRYPFSIPAIHGLDELELDSDVTFLIGENGSGKSTLIEAIAIAARFNAEGGSQNFNFATRRSESELHTVLRLVRGVRRPKTGYFLRAESYFNVATEVDRIAREVPTGTAVLEAHGGRSLHEQSHGESFLALVENRFYANGLYILDEPEAALSPQRQLSFLVSLDHLARRQNCQFIIATHSPIILAYPQAIIYALGPDGPTKVAYEDTEHYALTRDFLLNRDRYLRRLLTEE